MNKQLLLLALICLSPLASARMYQWVDPDTGTTQFSGKPPTWYRSGETGPRIVVYDKGRVIDDTGISLSPAEAESLRQEALISVEHDRQAALEKLQKAAEQKARLESDREEAPVEVIHEAPAAEADTGQEAAQDVPTAEELRALIDRYEQMKTEDARSVVETVNPENSPEPPAQK